MRRLLALSLALTALGCGGGNAPTRVSSPDDVALARVDDRDAFVRAEPLLDSVTRTRARTGNRTRLLVNGDASFARRYESLKDAEIVLVKTFIHASDETGRRVAELLAERARAGAFVVLQYDVRGSVTSPEDLADMLSRTRPDMPVGEKGFLHALRDAGVLVVPTANPTRAVEADEWKHNVTRFFRSPEKAVRRSLESLDMLDHMDHEKYWITGHRGPDGRITMRAIVGGLNIASEYAFGGTPHVDTRTKRAGWRDTDVEVEGPVVNDIVSRFFDLVDLHRGRELGAEVRARYNPPQTEAGEARARFVTAQPLVEQERFVEKAYEVLIDATPPGGVVRIENAYFAPAKRLRHALRRALERGTRLSILTNSPETNDVPVVSDGSRQAFYMLLREPGETALALYERRPRPDLGEAVLHSKVASFGTRGPIIVGSANLDAQSTEHNSEGILILEDESLRREFDAMYERDIANDRADRVTWETVESAGAWERFRQQSTHDLLWYWL